MTSPIKTEHDGIWVIRDDLYPGGSKARFIGKLFEGTDELVYASPAEGGAQFAMATVAAALGKRATIFVAARATPHPRAVQARRLGANVVEIRPGYLSTVQARAREYAAESGARLAPFGMDTPEAVAALSAAAKTSGLHPDEVWCAAGSGVLARALAVAWPNARRYVVQVGRELDMMAVPGATIFVHPKKFGQTCDYKPPFPSDPHYDAKAWEWLCTKHKRGPGLTVFWNVAGPADPGA